MPPKFQSTNELKTFEFHDAIIDSIKFDKNSIYWELYNVNITKDNSLNNYPTDMCLGLSNLVLKDIKEIKATIQGSCAFNEKGEIIKENPDIEIKQEKIEEKLNDLISNQYLDIFYLNEAKISDNEYKAEITCSGGEIIELSIIYKTSIISWNEFEKEAWYVNFNKKGGS